MGVQRWLLGTAQRSWIQKYHFTRTMVANYNLHRALKGWRSSNHRKSLSCHHGPVTVMSPWASNGCSFSWPQMMLLLSSLITCMRFNMFRACAKKGWLLKPDGTWCVFIPVVAICKGIHRASFHTWCIWVEILLPLWQHALKVHPMMMKSPSKLPHIILLSHNFAFLCIAEQLRGYVMWWWKVPATCHIWCFWVTTLPSYVCVAEQHRRYIIWSWKVPPIVNGPGHSI